MEKEMLSYLCRIRPVFIVFAGLIGGMAIVVAASDSSPAAPALGVAALLLLAGHIGLVMRRRSKLKARDDYERMVADFGSAQSMVNDKVRMGGSWIFGKGVPEPVRYDEIRRVFQYVHSTNFVEDSRQLRYVNEAGKQKTLCSLKLRGQSDDELVNIVKMILVRNPDVAVGYKNK